MKRSRMLPGVHLHECLQVLCEDLLSKLRCLDSKIVLQGQRNPQEAFLMLLGDQIQPCTHLQSSLPIHLKIKNIILQKKNMFAI